jgi:hypothetical protein
MHITEALVRRWPRITAAIATASAVLVTFTGCGPTSGTVLDKVHFPDLSYWTVGIDPATGRVVQVWVYNPECHRLTIDGDDGKIADTCVKARVYYSINVGDHWTKP